MTRTSAFTRACPMPAPVVAALALAAACAAAAAPACAAHLLISEVTVNPFGAQYIEIHNPNAKPVDLGNYYLTDASGYLRLPCCPPSLQFTDFCARFPAGASIAANGVVVVAFNASTYSAAFGAAPDFELPLADPPTPGVPDLDTAWGGSVSSARSIDSLSGEWIVLFNWDQLSDRVRDVDIIRVGNPGANDMLANKGNLCFDGPDAGGACDPYMNDALSMPAMALGVAPAGFSHKRRFLEGQREQQCNGNGIDNHDETSENSRVTWDGTAPNAYTAPTPGTVPTFIAAPGQCYADVNLSGVVDADDVVEVVLGWGACPNPIPCTGVCPADVAPLGCRDCSVNADDLVAVILNWGACP
jgi:hypothetical protein